MKKNIYNRIGSLALLSACLLLSANVVTAQTTVTIGTGTSSSYFYGPYYRSSASSSFDYSRYAYLYTATELGIPAGATIIKVEWNKRTGTINGSNVFNIFMKNTSSTSLTTGTSWGTLVTGATNVYASNTQAFMTIGWVPFTLDAPFEYTGGNLMIMTDHEKIGTASGSNTFYYTSASGYAIGYASGTAPTNSTTLSTSSYGNNRPNIRITWLPPCPAKVTTQPVNTSVCADDDAKMQVTADSTQAYRWQHFNGTTWIDLADGAAYSGTGTSILTIKNVQLSMDGFSYRVLAINTIENCSVDSDPANITVVPSSKASVVLTVGPDSSICDNETVTFHTAYSNGGSSPEYRWRLNGVEIPGETGATYTTNTLGHWDVIECRFISSAQCVKPVFSNPIRMNVTGIVPASVDVSLYSEAENEYTFTALPVNGGPAPEYYWYINGKMVPDEHGETFVAEDLLPYDKVTVDMKTSLDCAEPLVSSSRNVTTAIANTKADARAFSISPNPNSGKFIITGRLANDAAQNEITFKITNAVGQVVHAGSYIQSGSNINLPVEMDSSLPAGLYIINITAGAETTGIRFITQ